MYFSLSACTHWIISSSRSAALLPSLSLSLFSFDSAKRKLYYISTSSLSIEAAYIFIHFYTHPAGLALFCSDSKKALQTRDKIAEESEKAVVSRKDIVCIYHSDICTRLYALYLPAWLFFLSPFISSVCSFYILVSWSFCSCSFIAKRGAVRIATFTISHVVAVGCASEKADFLLRTTLVFSSGNVNLLCIFILSCKITRATCYNIIFNTRRTVYGEVFCVLPVLMVRLFLWSSLQLCGNNNDNIISNILCNLFLTNLLQVLRKTRRHHQTLSGKTRKFKFVRAARYNFFSNIIKLLRIIIIVFFSLHWRGNGNSYILLKTSSISQGFFKTLVYHVLKLNSILWKISFSLHVRA